MTELDTAEATLPPEPATRPVKLIVWDLDETLWKGVLAEGDDPQLFPQIKKLLAELDQHGILQSIASRNDFEQAAARLTELGVFEYFLQPRIGWGAKSSSVADIARSLNIGLDTVVFVDDQEFERAEVQHSHPEVRTLKAVEAQHHLTDLLQSMPAVTADAGRRRRLYQEEDERSRAAGEFAGTPEQFMGTLRLELTVRRASLLDLDRAQELVARTNQLNSSGITYSKSQLHAFLDSPTHILLVATLKDRFGDYGTIGLVLLQVAPGSWTLKLILVSCRVLSRGIGSALLGYLAQRAEAAGVSLQIEFRDTGKNRPMKIALMMTGFKRLSVDGDIVLFARDGCTETSLPTHLSVLSTW